jgi:hypothetical protein
MSSAMSPLGVSDALGRACRRRVARGRRHGVRSRSAVRVKVLIAVAGAALFVAASARADAPPVGPLPAGPTATIATQKGEFVAVALPRRAGGRVWRLARRIDAGILRQVSEANVGANVVVVVFRAVGAGTTAVAFGLTRGETPRAFESRRYSVRVNG